LKFSPLAATPQACKIQMNRGHITDEAELKKLVGQMQAYKAGLPPYNQLYAGEQSQQATRLWWSAINAAGTNIIVNLAILLLDVVPHAAAPERLFSMLGWFQSNLRNRLSVGTTGMMAVTRQHLQEIYRSQTAPASHVSRPAKRVRTESGKGGAVEVVAVEEYEVESDSEPRDDDVTEEDIDELVEALAGTYADDNERHGGIAEEAAPLELDRLLDVWRNTGLNPADPALDPFKEVALPASAAPLGGLRTREGLQGALGVAVLVAAEMPADM
jgi:hypothetical protein